uniref:Uncharacterized protein n=1 Tax=Rhizophora mucronata TaxID=61149 RepID=A0A2P2PXK8_RHIMU
MQSNVLICIYSKPLKTVAYPFYSIKMNTIFCDYLVFGSY